MFFCKNPWYRHHWMKWRDKEMYVFHLFIIYNWIKFTSNSCQKGTINGPFLKKQNTPRSLSVCLSYCISCIPVEIGQFLLFKILVREKFFLKTRLVFWPRDVLILYCYIVKIPTNNIYTNNLVFLFFRTSLSQITLTLKWCNKNYINNCIDHWCYLLQIKAIKCQTAVGSRFESANIPRTIHNGGMTALYTV